MTFAINYYAENQKFVEYDEKYTMSPWFFVDLGLTTTGADHAVVSQDVQFLDAKGQFKPRSELEPQLKEDVKKDSHDMILWVLSNTKVPNLKFLHKMVA
ncbi:hypothetical protein AAFF39_08855 [Lactococcus garvieae]